MREIEEWKSLEFLEYPDYEVSNWGRVKSLERVIIYKDGREKILPERILKLTKDNNGYLNVILCKNGKIKRFRVHRLVASAFISNPYNLPQVNHKDENKENNNVENLEFCTAKHNSNYGTRNKRLSKINKGKISPNKKPILQYTKDNIFVREWDSATSASIELNLSQGNITACCNGKRKTCGGFLWKYKESI